MRCAVCGRSGGEVAEYLTEGGERYGMACPGECAGLLWDAWYARRLYPAGHPRAEYEQGLVVWRWRQRRDQVEGRATSMPPPRSPAERQLERVLAGGAL